MRIVGTYTETVTHYQPEDRAFRVIVRHRQGHPHYTRFPLRVAVHHQECGKVWSGLGALADLEGLLADARTRCTIEWLDQWTINGGPEGE